MNRSLRNSRAGFTLLEVVLAIALSSVLLGLLTLAVDQYLVNVQASRDAVEHAQVARGVLRMIADDLRNMASAHHQDVSAARQLADSASSGNGGTEREGQSGAASDSPDSFDNVTDAGTPAPAMGVSGDLATLQVDVLRTRLRVDPPEEFAAQTSDAAGDGPPAAAGIATVRYSLDSAGGGLVRQQVPRELALWEDQQGATGLWDAAYRVVAEQVTALEFRYNDGATPFEAWDLDDHEGESPRVVEVRVTLREPINHRTNSDERDTTPTRTYRMTVALPTFNEGAAAAGDSSGGAAGGFSSGSQQGGTAGGSGGR